MIQHGLIWGGMNTWASISKRSSLPYFKWGPAESPYQLIDSKDRLSYNVAQKTKAPVQGTRTRNRLYGALILCIGRKR